MYNQTRTGTW